MKIQNMYRNVLDKLAGIHFTTLGQTHPPPHPLGGIALSNDMLLKSADHLQIWNFLT